MPKIANRVVQQKVTTVSLDQNDVLSIMKATACALMGVDPATQEDADCTVLIEREDSGWIARVSFTRELPITLPEDEQVIEDTASKFWPKIPEVNSGDSELHTDSDGRDERAPHRDEDGA